MGGSGLEGQHLVTSGRNEAQISCSSCGFTLGWLIRVAGQRAIVRNPLARLEIEMKSHQWMLSCPTCGRRWRPGDAMEGRLLVT